MRGFKTLLEYILENKLEEFTKDVQVLQSDFYSNFEKAYDATKAGGFDSKPTRTNIQTGPLNHLPDESLILQDTTVPRYGPIPTLCAYLDAEPRSLNKNT